MKKALLYTALLCKSFFAYADMLKWDGDAGDGIWSTAINWSGDRAPGPSDDVLLDNSFVQSSYLINLPVGNVALTVRSLTITASGVYQITVVLPILNTSGTAFTATGDGDAIVLNSGAVFINESGATAGTPVSVGNDNFFRINNGGRYIHRTQRGHTANLVNRLSTAAGTERGIFEFDVPAASFLVSLTGRTYGSLVLSAAANGAPVTYSGNGINPLHINGDLQINPGATMSNGMSAEFIIHHDLHVADSAVFNLQNAAASNTVGLAGNLFVQGELTETGSGVPILELNGTGAQILEVPGSINNSIILRVNNAAGADLLSSLSVGYQLQLQSGKIRTTAAALAILGDNATYTGGSASSFIDGPMKKAGDDAQFVFPVGKGNIYAPIGFYSPGMLITDTMQAEYLRANPQSLFGNNYETGIIDHISHVEYWRLIKTAGTVLPTSVTLTATTYSFARKLSTLLIGGHHPGEGQWKDRGAALITAGIPYPPYMTGDITSEPLLMLGNFTLATSDRFTDNPLPVRLISFTAARPGPYETDIRWELADCCDQPVYFELQGAGENKQFTYIAGLPGQRDKNLYLIKDDHPAGRASRYYRLKITGQSGDSSFSNVVRISRTDNELHMAVTPSMVNDRAMLVIHAAAADRINVVICDIQGRTVKQFQQAVVPGRNSVPLGVTGLRRGIYFLKGISSSGIQANTTRFVKQ